MRVGRQATVAATWKHKAREELGEHTFVGGRSGCSHVGHAGGVWLMELDDACGGNSQHVLLPASNAKAPVMAYIHVGVVLPPGRPDVWLCTTLRDVITDPRRVLLAWVKPVRSCSYGGDESMQIQMVRER